MSSTTLKSFMRSFVDGYGRAIDIGATRQKIVFDEILDVSDDDAIRSDWEAVGSDLKYGITAYDRRKQKQLTAAG